MPGGTVSDRMSLYIREIVFGLEDSLVSTLGAVTGVAVGSGDRSMVILTGLVIVAVEAISMAAGSYLSAKSAQELYEERFKQDEARVLAERVSDAETLRDFFERKGFSAAEIQVALAAVGRERKLWLQEVHRGEYRLSATVNASPFGAGVTMGLWYIAGGLIVLVPYLLLPLGQAGALSIVLTIIALFTLGVVKGKVTGLSKVRSGLEMVAVSLGAALVGLLIGWGVPRLL